MAIAISDITKPELEVIERLVETRFVQLTESSFLDDAEIEITEHLCKLAGLKSFEQLVLDVHGAYQTLMLSRVLSSEGNDAEAQSSLDSLIQDYKYGQVIYEFFSTRREAVAPVALAVFAGGGVGGDRQFSMDSLNLLIEPGTAPPEAIADLLAEISKLYRMIGGSGITFVPTEVRLPSEVAS